MVSKKQKSRKHFLNKALQRLNNYSNCLWECYKDSTKYIEVRYNINSGDINDKDISNVFKKLIQRFNYFMVNIYPHYLKYIKYINELYNKVLGDFYKHTIRVKSFRNKLYNLCLDYFPFKDYLKSTIFDSKKVNTYSHLKYVAVKQIKDDTISFHILFFNLPLIDNKVIRNILGKDFIHRYYFDWVKNIPDIINSLNLLVTNEEPFIIKKIEYKIDFDKALKKFVRIIKSNFKFHKCKSNYFSIRIKFFKIITIYIFLNLSFFIILLLYRLKLVIFWRNFVL